VKYFLTVHAAGDRDTLGPMRRVVIVASILLAPGCGGGGGGGGDGGNPTGDGGGGADAVVPVAPACDPLEPGGGPVIAVTPAQAAQLGQIAHDAPSGAVIELADGTYPVSADVVMNLDKPLTLISASRDASRVILDGGSGHTAREIVQITASGVTVAHITIQNARDHLIHLYPGAGADIRDITIHGVVLVDSGQHFIKSNADLANADFATAHFVDYVTVSCSTFTMSQQGRDYVPTNPDNASYPCYTGGIDAHAARGWHVVRNRFDGIYCDVDSLAEHAIHFWHCGRDQVIEQNVVTDCARGIGLGLYWGDNLVERPYADMPHAGDKVDTYVANYDGIIRNNAIWADVAGFDTGINVEQAIGARIYHNSVLLGGAAAGNPIEYRWPNSIVDLRNNLAAGVVARDGASGTVRANLAAAAGDFVDAPGGDFHLTGPTATGVDQGEDLGGAAGLDLDGAAHDDGPPDLGADELGN